MQPSPNVNSKSRPAVSWLLGDDPPEDPTQTDDTTKSGSLPVEGADEPPEQDTEN